jgi:hypothetical protein
MRAYSTGHASTSRGLPTLLRASRSFARKSNWTLSDRAAGTNHETQEEGNDGREYHHESRRALVARDLIRRAFLQKHPTRQSKPERRASSWRLLTSDTELATALDRAVADEKASIKRAEEHAEHFAAMRRDLELAPITHFPESGKKASA